MDLNLKNKIAVVTGSSKGIGYSIAKDFLLEGAIVAICARNEKKLLESYNELSKYGEVYYKIVDVTSDKEVYDFAHDVYKKYGKINCWVNNVGAVVNKSKDEFSEEEINKTVSICFNSVVYGCQAAFRYMKDTGGSIINISSLAARCGTAGRSTLYGPLKSAVVGLSVMYAAEYSAYGIRVNSVLPGFTLTPKVEETISKEELEYNIKNSLIRRMASAEDISSAIVFLSSSKASYITAASLEISGGRNVVLNPSFSYDNKK